MKIGISILKSQKFRFSCFLAIGFAAVIFSQNKTVQGQNFSEDKVSYPEQSIYESSKLVNSNNIQQLQQLSSDKITVKTKKEISKTQLEEGNFFLALMSYSEGFKSQLYKDNKGFAIGMGWNLSLQSEQFNKELAKAVLHDESQIEALSSLSGKNHKDLSQDEIDNLKSIKLNHSKSLQIGFLIAENIEKTFLTKAIEHHLSELGYKKPKAKSKQILNLLSKNEKESLIYHIYKVGPNGSQKYKNLFSNLIDYAQKKTTKNQRKVLDEIKYFYRENGKIIEDEQSTKLVRAMFKDPHHFAEITKISLKSNKSSTLKV